MNEFKRPAGEVKKSIDTTWMENLKKLEGHEGIDILPNDREDLVSRLIKAVKDRDKIPFDLDNPETMTEVEAVDKYATNLYNVACEIQEVAELMMVGSQVEKVFNDTMDELGETMSDDEKMREAGLNNGSF